MELFLAVEKPWAEKLVFLLKDAKVVKLDCVTEKVVLRHMTRGCRRRRKQRQRPKTFGTTTFRRRKRMVPTPSLVYSPSSRGYFPPRLQESPSYGPREVGINRCRFLKNSNFHNTFSVLTSKLKLAQICETYYLYSYVKFRVDIL
jgi:hypothetical protein